MRVNRVEQHIINKNHLLFKQIDDYSFLSKNLYNYANYYIRQVFIITSKLSKREEITKEQQGFLNNVNKIYNLIKTISKRRLENEIAKTTKLRKKGCG